MHVGLRWIGSLLEGSPDHTTSPVLLQVWTQPPHAREPCVLGIFLKAFAFFQHPQPAQSCNRPMADTLANVLPSTLSVCCRRDHPPTKLGFGGNLKCCRQGLVAGRLLACPAIPDSKCYLTIARDLSRDLDRVAIGTPTSCFAFRTQNTLVSGRSKPSRQ